MDLAAPRRARGVGRARWWLGLAVTMLVSVPCLVVEEDWHGKAMIDLGSLLWVPFAVAVALAFLVGGAVAASGPGRRRRRRHPHLVAVGRGLSCGLSAILLLVVCDLVRRFGVLHEGLSVGVVELWLDAGIGAAALSGASAGFVSALGRDRAPQRRSGLARSWR